MTRAHPSVFVDRYGRRRRAVVGTGVLVAAVLVAWLALMGIVIATVVPHSQPSVPADAGTN
jgi:hypothetical protein